MHFIYHIPIELWRQKVALFWPIWITLTVVAAFSAAWLVGREGKTLHKQNKKNPMRFAVGSRFGWSRGDWLSIALFGFFVACYIALIFVWEDFAYYDNSQFTLFTLKGHNFPTPIWIEAGRFCPLTLQEFNLIRHFGSSAASYHVLPVLQLLIVSFILLILDRNLGMKARVCLAASALLAPSVVISFGGLIFPERNIVFWLLCLAFFVNRFDRTQSTAAVVAAIVCAQFMLYYKETAFLFLWGFVAGRLLLRCRSADRPGWNLSRLREKASRLDLCLASLGLVFLLYYGAVMFRHSNFQYAHQARLPEMKVILSYYRADLLAWLFMAVIVGKTCLIWQRRITPSPFWDGLAYGAMSYFAGFIFLGMFTSYYLAPVDFIAVLCLGRFAFLSWGKQHLGSKIAVVITLCGVLTQNVSLSAYRVFERKNLIHAKAEIASAIQAQKLRGTRTSQRLFFPFANRYVTMEFAAYLNYRGMNVEGVEGTSQDKTSVVVVSKAMNNDGPLMDYRSIMGHAAAAPEPGDLVIVLPDDCASLAQVVPYLRGGDTIFSYEPHPRLPRWVDFSVRHLYCAYPNIFPIPDRWLNASVTVWKGSNTIEP